MYACISFKLLDNEIACIFPYKYNTFLFFILKKSFQFLQIIFIFSCIVKKRKCVLQTKNI